MRREGQIKVSNCPAKDEPASADMKVAHSQQATQSSTHTSTDLARSHIRLGGLDTEQRTL